MSYRSLPTCQDFAQNGKQNLCSMLSSKLGLPLDNICSLPEPRAAWTDLVNASSYLEDAIVLPFRVLYGIQQMPLATVKMSMLASLNNAYYKIYYAWMYLCIASGNNLQINHQLTPVISDASLAMAAIQKLSSTLQSVPENITDLNNFAATYIYGFQGVISHLSDSILNAFKGVKY